MSNATRDILLGLVLLLVGMVAMLIGNTFVEQGIDAESGAALGFVAYACVFLAVFHAVGTVAKLLDDWRLKTIVRVGGGLYFAVEYLTYSRVPALGELNLAVQDIAFVMALGFFVIAVMTVPKVSDALEQQLTSFKVMQE